MKTNVLKRVAVCGVISFALSSASSAKSWWAKPVIAHEWGVNTYDWSGKNRHDPQLPAFFYTDKKPGNQFLVANKVKDMAPDSGMRSKPILYFYPSHDAPIPLGVEVRFTHGYANAWYPQVNAYRTVAQVKKAKPVDWQKWKRENKRHFVSGKLAPVPDDHRFELVWHNLTLNAKEPIPSFDVKDHWLHQAREVDAATVSNGKEHEKFVFYEGATTELPAFALLPSQDGNSINLVNTSEDTIYDVFIVYRKGEVRSVSHYESLAPMPQQNLFYGKGRSVIPCISFPNFERVKMANISEESFTAGSSHQLTKQLTKGNAHGNKFGYGGGTMRDPADSQPATTMHTLYQKEARGLEKIWRKDFFQQEGLTIIYRESPAYLDKAMPLNIYTDMRHYIQLNRCGLVCNQNIDLANLATVQQASRTLLHSQRPNQESIDLCKKHSLLHKSYLQYYLKMGESFATGFSHVDDSSIRLSHFSHHEKNGVFHIKGKVAIHNKSNKPILGNPLARVTVTLKSGDKKLLLREEDIEDCSWEEFHIEPNKTSVVEFDGALEIDQEVVSFTVTWDGNEELQTHPRKLSK